MSLPVLASHIAEMLKSDPEIGRELKAKELKVGTVVVVVPPPYRAALTVWITGVDIGAGILLAHAGTINNTIISRFDDAGNVFDDRGLPVFIFEYKGAI